MLFTTRPYASRADLERMRTLVMQAHSQYEQQIYLHPGDITWRVWDTLVAYEPQQVVQLWEDPHGDLAAFSLMYPMYAGFDLQIHPRYASAGLAEQVLMWTEQRTRELITAEGRTGPVDAWDVFEDDHARIALLEHHGYRRRDDLYVYATRSLSGPMSAPVLSPGFFIPPLLAPAMVAERIAHRPDLTLERYMQFMHAPGYQADLDLVVATTDGRFGAYWICWLDTVNQIGLCEPVGTRPDFRRQGLGRAVLQEGLRRMRSHGMVTAAVCYEASNAAAERLYQSVGFTPRATIYTYRKDG